MRKDAVRGTAMGPAMAMSGGPSSLPVASVKAHRKRHVPARPHLPRTRYLSG